MAHKRKEVRRRDVRQGKTFWLVDVVIVDGMSIAARQERMERYPNNLDRWASDDAWGRARVKEVQRVFVRNSREMLEELSILLEASKLFYRHQDAQVYYNRVAQQAAMKQAVLEARFPAFINPARNWIGKDLALTLAEVPLDVSMLPNRLKLNH